MNERLDIEVFLWDGLDMPTFGLAPQSGLESGFPQLNFYKWFVLRVFVNISFNKELP